MAIDTHDKKAAAMAVGLPFIMITPIADGSISAADRAIMAHVYPMTFGAPSEETGDVVFGMTKTIRTIRQILEPYGHMYI